MQEVTRPLPQSPAHRPRGKSLGKDSSGPTFPPAAKMANPSDPSSRPPSSHDSALVVDMPDTGVEPVHKFTAYQTPPSRNVLYDSAWKSVDSWNPGDDPTAGFLAAYEHQTKAQTPFAPSAHRESILTSGNLKEPQYRLSKVGHGGRLEDDLLSPASKVGNTALVMGLLADMWLFNLIIIMGSTYLMTFHLPQYYLDDELWNTGCWWKLAWLLPLPYTLICFFGLVMPFRTPRWMYSETLHKRRLDNLYILTVTKGDNREAVMRSWNAHKNLEHLHPAIKVHVLTDEPNYFDNINCYTCPLSFKTKNSKYKARALEWYRRTIQYTEHDWVLHLDEESVVDEESMRRILDFIWYEKKYHWGQGVILYNQYRYWKNWIFTVADAIRVGDDLSRFQLQYTYFNRPIFGAHGSFLLTNGAVENAVTWDLGSLTEDYEFATIAWEKGFKCGKVPALVREQSPMDHISFMKQRRRWFVGIRRLPDFLPKMWATFWMLGTLSLYGTIASVVLGIVYPMGTPRWFGFVKDFSFVVFVYLYLLGIFIQDIDAVILESVSVTYGILFPPAGFEVIRK